MDIQVIASDHHLSTAATVARRDAVSRRPGFRRAIAQVGRNVQLHLSSLTIVVELLEVYERARARRARDGTAAEMPEKLVGLLHELIERAHRTGDPLPYRAGVVDVSEIVRRAVKLNAPIAASRGLEIRMDMLAPLVVCGDARLLVDAIASLLIVILRIGMGVIDCRVGLRDGNAFIEIAAETGRAFNTGLARCLSPFDADDADGATANLDAWMARIIVERHGGAVGVEPSQNGRARIEVTLPGGLL
jgi:two-component system, sensor histidine kinase RpfC